MPPSNSIDLTNSNQILHANNINDIELLIKQYSNINYENYSDSGEEDEASKNELNDSLEIPIEETEPNFEVSNFSKILEYLEVRKLLN